MEAQKGYSVTWGQVNIDMDFLARDDSGYGLTKDTRDKNKEEQSLALNLWHFC